MLVRALRPRARKVKVKHLRACHYRDVPSLIVTLRASERASPVVKLAIEFATVTAARSGEVRGAMWGEIDLEAKTWVIPDERMKANEAHTVHLPKRAVEILRVSRCVPSERLRASARIPDAAGPTRSAVRHDADDGFEPNQNRPRARRRRA
jgi:integrase